MKEFSKCDLELSIRELKITKISPFLKVEHHSSRACVHESAVGWKTSDSDTDTYGRGLGQNLSTFCILTFHKHKNLIEYLPDFYRFYCFIYPVPNCLTNAQKNFAN